jgi:hypothetical protein
MAAPTRNFEYGACAFFITFLADRSSFADTVAGIVFWRITEKFSRLTGNRGSL